MCFYWNDAFLLSANRCWQFLETSGKKIYSESMIIAAPPSPVAAAAVVLHSEIFPQTENEKQSQFNSWQSAKNEKEEPKEMMETESKQKCIAQHSKEKEFEQRSLKASRDDCLLSAHIPNVHNEWHS